MFEFFSRNKKNGIYECNALPFSGSKKHDTFGLQFEIAQKILTLNDKDYEKFGTKEGNVACLNYFPIARIETNEHYVEEEFFFGLNSNNKFLVDMEKERIDLFKQLMCIQRNKADNGEHIWLIIMGKDIKNKGNSTCHKLFPILKEVFNIPYSSLDEFDNELIFSCSRKSVGYKFFVESAKILFLPHPGGGYLLFRDIENLL